MSHLLQEERLSFPALAASEGVNVSTVWRWALRGCRGAVLESFSVGGRRYTTKQAFGRFVDSTNTSPSLAVVAARAPSRNRLRAIERAEQDLNEAGI